MKYQFAALAMACTPMSASAFLNPSSFGMTTSSSTSSSSSLNMVLEAPKKVKKLAKIETLKVNSDHLIHPLKEVSLYYCQIIIISLYDDCIVVLSYHLVLNFISHVPSYHIQFIIIVIMIYFHAIIQH